MPDCNGCEEGNHHDIDAKTPQIPEAGTGDHADCGADDLANAEREAAADQPADILFVTTKGVVAIGEIHVAEDR